MYKYKKLPLLIINYKLCIENNGILTVIGIFFCSLITDFVTACIIGNWHQVKIPASKFN